MESRHLTFSIRNFKFEIPFFKTLAQAEKWVLAGGHIHHWVAQSFSKEKVSNTEWGLMGIEGDPVSKSDCQS